MNLIVLKGQGDVDIKIVDDETWNKLNRNNDKMLEMEDNECIKTFWNDMSAFSEWCQENNAKFNKEYHGYIY